MSTRIDVYTCGDHQTPSSRLRWGNYSEEFLREGYDFSLRTARHYVYKKVAMKRCVRKADVIIIQKVAFAPWVLRTFRKRTKRLILDLDDAIWLPNSSSKSNLVSFNKKLTKMWFFHSLPIYDKIIVSNLYLADFVKPSNNRISIIPTSPSDETILQCSSPAHLSNRFTLGWTGTKDNIYYLHSIESALYRFFSDFPNSQLVVVSDGLFRSKFPLVDERTTNIPWTIDNEQRFLRLFDVGLMPLTNDSWAMGKSAFKLILYFKHSVPSVASSFGYQTQFVIDGKNALLASDDDQWYTKLKMLAEEPDLRKKLGEEALRVYQEKFTKEAIFSQYLRVIEKE